MSDEFTLVLGNSKLFQALEKGELAALASLTTPIHFKAGETVFKEGEPGDSFYQVVEGKVAIMKKDSAGGPEHQLAMLGENDILGEMGLLTDVPRSATARCMADTQLLRILKSDFDALLEAGNLNANRVVRHMARALCDRLRGMNEVLGGLLHKQTAKSTPELAALRERLMKDWTF
jgi:CRP-like cAMP-binding protein